MKSKISKDEALENAIITSAKNPWHCLYLKDGKAEIAKTFINTNRFYRLRTLKTKYEPSIRVHEYTHTQTCKNMPFKAFLLVSSIFEQHGIGEAYAYENFDSLFIYNNEIVPFLEAEALIFQLLNVQTPKDLKEGIISHLKVNDPLSILLISDLGEIIKKFTNKKIPRFRPEDFVPATYVIMSFINNSPNWIRERVFDRFRLLRDLSFDKIKKWKDINDLYTFINDYFYQNNFRTVDLRRPFHIIAEARVWASMKDVLNKISTLSSLKPFIFGFLGEVDNAFSPISYVCDSLNSLPGKKTLPGEQIDICHLGKVALKKEFYTTLQKRQTDIDQILSNRHVVSVTKLDVQSMEKYKDTLKQLEKIKKNIFKNCPGPDYCKGKEECKLQDEICQQVKNLLVN